MKILNEEMEKVADRIRDLNRNEKLAIAEARTLDDAKTINWNNGRTLRATHKQVEAIYSQLAARHNLPESLPSSIYEYDSNKQTINSLVVDAIREACGYLHEHYFYALQHLEAEEFLGREILAEMKEALT